MFLLKCSTPHRSSSLHLACVYKTRMLLLTTLASRGRCQEMGPLGGDEVMLGPQDGISCNLGTDPRAPCSFLKRDSEQMLSVNQEAGAQQAAHLPVLSPHTRVPRAGRRSWSLQPSPHTRGSQELGRSWSLQPSLTLVASRAGRSWSL